MLVCLCVLCCMLIGPSLSLCGVVWVGDVTRAGPQVRSDPTACLLHDPLSPPNDISSHPLTGSHSTPTHTHHLHLHLHLHVDNIRYLLILFIYGLWRCVMTIRPLLSSPHRLISISLILTSLFCVAHLASPSRQSDPFAISSDNKIPDDLRKKINEEVEKNKRKDPEKVML